jgi:hypothetical protein
MRFISETDAQAIRAHLDKKLEGAVTLDLFIESKSAIVVPGSSGGSREWQCHRGRHRDQRIS